MSKCNIFSDALSRAWGHVWYLCVNLFGLESFMVEWIIMKKMCLHVDWPWSGLVQVWALFSQMQTLTIGFGPADWWTQTQNFLNLVL